MDKKNVLIYINKNLDDRLKEKIIRNIDDQDNHIMICSPNKKILNDFSTSFHDFQYILLNQSHYSRKEKMLIRLFFQTSFFHSLLNKKVKNIFLKKMRKKTKGIEFDKVIYIADTHLYTIFEFSTLKCQKEYIDIDESLLCGEVFHKNYKKSKDLLNYYFDKRYVLKDETQNHLYEQIKWTMISHQIKERKDSYSFLLRMKIDSRFAIDFRCLQMKIGEFVCNIQVKKHSFFYDISFDLKKDIILDLPTQNKMFFLYTIDNHQYEYQINYTYLKKKFMKSKIYSIDGKSSFYLRQSKFNKLYFTVRLTNRTDSFIENLKINIAYYLSKFVKKDIYLLYEKDSARYEESASVLYERLIDMGYKNAFFILDVHSPHYQNIQEKYKKNILPKYSFKHYFYFFVSHHFFGSELMVHAMELRIMNKHVLEKIEATDVNYVFLQHGVMYMISLDSESRNYFQPRKDGKGKFRVVTSSKMEARHFTELGGYNQEQVLITGLPKYDRNVLNEDANKIVVMPTWRAWEYNTATTHFKETPYYKMLERIESVIPDSLKENLIILPHPLFYKAAANNEFPLKKYMKFNVKYDEILRTTKVLITDYSSIAYDAFYRGCNVIFYWEELADCLLNYGKNTKLMLNKDNVFGDICYNKEELSKVINQNYSSCQNSIYLTRYNQLVDFHDGKNTERLIQVLMDEKILR